jgi:mannose-6-phosphate isomerase-like protein (cupin superfamily)
MPQGLSAVNISEKFALFSDRWAPKIIGAFNDLHIKAAKLKGGFVWHSHADIDELFLVTKGSLIVHLRNATVMANAGNFFVVPRGVEHMPVAEERVRGSPLRTAGHGEYRQCRRRAHRHLRDVDLA